MFNFSLTPVVRNLLILNFVIFLVDHYNILPLTETFSLRYILSPHFYPFQFLTYMFLHASFSHVFFNMFPLFMFGPLLERYWDSKKFLAFYIFTGVGAGLMHAGITYFEIYSLNNAVLDYITHPGPDQLTAFLAKHSQSLYRYNYDFISAYAENPADSNFISQSISLVKTVIAYKSDIPMVGASGAIFGILMAFGLTFPQTELFIFPLPVPIKAWVYVTVYGIIELYAGVHTKDGDNVAHFAHIGGMIFAYIMIRLWKHKGNNYY